MRGIYFPLYFEKIHLVTARTSKILLYKVMRFINSMHSHCIWDGIFPSTGWQLVFYYSKICILYTFIVHIYNLFWVLMDACASDFQLQIFVICRDARSDMLICLLIKLMSKGIFMSQCWVLCSLFPASRGMLVYPDRGHAFLRWFTSAHQKTLPMRMREHSLQVCPHLICKLIPILYLLYSGGMSKRVLLIVFLCSTVEEKMARNL